MFGWFDHLIKKEPQTPAAPSYEIPAPPASPREPNPNAPDWRPNSNTTKAAWNVATAQAEPAPRTAEHAHPMQPEQQARPTPPRRIAQPLPRESSRASGHIWQMDPATQLATNSTTREVRYIPNMRATEDARGNFSGLEPIPPSAEQEAQFRRNPNYRGVFRPRSGFPVLAFDAGHGVEYPNAGTPDNGASSDNGTPHNRSDDISEANITLHLANHAAAHATRNHFDAIVTRTTQTFSHAPNVATRKDAFDFRIAAANNASAYVSFHVNHAQNEAANGTQIYIQRNAPDHANTERFGNVLAANIRKGTKKSNGEPNWDVVRDERFLDANAHVNPQRIKNFAMIRGIHVPSALIETGFIQNGADATPGDYDDLRNNAYLKAFGTEVADDMMRYLRVTRPQQISEQNRDNPNTTFADAGPSAPSGGPSRRASFQR